MATALTQSRYFKQIFGIDLRTLALFRIGLGLTILLDIASISGDISAFLSDMNLLTRKDAMNNAYSWSLYFINGHIYWSYFLLTITALSAIMLIFGYRTRFMTFICWVLLISLARRLTIINSGADQMLNVMLFLGMFLPLGARFSIDSALCKAEKGENAYVSWATFIAMLQVAGLYVFSALLKTGSGWHQNYDTIYMVLNTHDINTYFAQFIVGNPEVLRWLTFYVWHLEVVAILFLFSPVKNAQMRIVMIVLLGAMHIGFAIFLAISFFPAISLTGLALFIPGMAWNKLLPKFNALPKRRGITMYYDLDCGFCYKTCLIFRELSLPTQTQIVPAQDDSDIYAIMQKENSWVVKDGAGMLRTRWNAVAWIFRRSPLLWIVGIVFYPKFMQRIGDEIYEFIAQHRGAFGNFSGKYLPFHECKLDFGLSRGSQLLIGVCATLILLMNLGTLPKSVFAAIPKPIYTLTDILGLQQNWRLFAPEGRRVTEWVVVEGHLTDGRVVDLVHDKLETPSHDRPDSGYSVYRSHRWHKFYTHIKFERDHKRLGDYYCRHWEDIRTYGWPDIKTIVLTAYRQFTPPPGKDPGPVEKRYNFTHDCMKKAPPPPVEEPKTEGDNDEEKKPFEEPDASSEPLPPDYQ